MVRLITRAELYALGITSTVIPSELRAQPEDDDGSTIEMCIAAASEDVLTALSFLTLPLVSYGLRVRRWTAVLAAWYLKTAPGFPSEDPEAVTRQKAYEQVIAQLDAVAERRRAPYGVVDSSEPQEDEETAVQGRLLMKGYPKVTVGLV